MSAYYVNLPPHVALLCDGRIVQLLRPFSFVDSKNLAWEVPTDAKVDGASIPRIFWSLAGGPLDGKYRDPSIIHDWYCITRERSWQETHRVFYDAMIVSHVPQCIAKVMYFAVRCGGPRWGQMTSDNINLFRQLSDLKDEGFEVQEHPDGLVELSSPNREAQRFSRDLGASISILSRDYPTLSLERIDQIADGLIRLHKDDKGEG